MASTASGQAAASRGLEGDGEHLAGGGRHLDLAAHGDHSSGSSPLPCTSAVMSSGVRGHRQHPAAGAEQAGHPVEPVDVVVQQVPERDDEQVAHRVAVHLALGLEAVLQHPGPGLPPAVVAAQGRQRHPQVTRREHAELVAQPAGGAAVVGDRDDRRQVGGHAAQGGQGRGEAVPAPEGDDGRLGRPCARCPTTPGRGRGGWSRPPARTCAAASTISSDIATLRCLPPVQPIATVMNRLPSRR